MQALVGRLRSLDLRGAQSADDAIRLGSVDSWKQLDGLREEYQQLRAAQVAVATGLWDGTGAELKNLRTWGRFRNYGALARDHRPPGGELWGAGSDSGATDGPPWTSTDPSVEWEFVFRTPEAQPWVPTQRQLEEAIRAWQQPPPEVPGPDVRRPHIGPAQAIAGVAPRRLQNERDVRRELDYQRAAAEDARKLQAASDARVGSY
jgi:hypothetical protein